MAGPLFNMGTFFREIDQAGVDMEDLFFMLKQQPVVKEKEDAAEFEYKTGQITFEKLGFKHYIPLTNSDKDERAKPDDFE
jgi:ABC-type transport system involved in Fe-S cluster assembly fused permease/ATPase subunit